MFSSVLFDILRQRIYGITIKSAVTKETIELAGFGFVDNTDLVKSGSSRKYIAEVANILHGSIDWYEIGSNTSGVELVPSKNWGTFIEFTRTDKDCAYIIYFEHNNLIISEDTESVKVNIDFDILNPTEAKYVSSIFSSW